MSEKKLWNVITFEEREQFSSANKQQRRENLTDFHSCLIVQKILIQYPLICELTIIYNKQFKLKIMYNETRMHFELRKSWNAKPSLFLRFTNIDHEWLGNPKQTHQRLSGNNFNP